MLKSSSGQTWEVKIEEEITINDEDNQTVRNLCFCGGGWTKFLDDLEIKLGEFLVFCFDGDSTFDVSVFGTNCCERKLEAEAMEVDSDAEFTNVISTKGIGSPAGFKFPARSGRGRPPKKSVSKLLEEGYPGTDEDEDEDESDSEFQKCSHNAADHVVYKRRESKALDHTSRPSMRDGCLKLSNPLYFEILLKPHQIYRLWFGKEFKKASGLQWRQSVLVEYVPTHYRQSIELDHRYGRVDLARGWRKFGKANGLVVGRTYSFEFKPEENVIRVNEVNRRN